MGIIDSIILSLVARTSSYDRKMRQSRRVTSEFTRSISKLRGTISFLKSGILGSLGSVGFGALTAATARSARGIVSTSNKAKELGFTSVKHLQRIRLEAEAAGISVSDVDAALAKMNTTLHKGQKLGTREHFILKRLGIGRGRQVGKKFIEGDTRFKFEQVQANLQSFQARSDTAQRDKDIESIFGSRKMVPFFEMTRKEIGETIKRAEELGRITGDENVAAVRKLEQSWKELKGTIGAVQDASVTKNAKALANAHRELSDTIAKEGGLFTDLGQEIQTVGVHAATSALQIGAMLAEFPKNFVTISEELTNPNGPLGFKAQRSKAEFEKFRRSDSIREFARSAAGIAVPGVGEFSAPGQRGPIINRRSKGTVGANFLPGGPIPPNRIGPGTQGSDAVVRKLDELIDVVRDQGGGGGLN